MLLVGENTCRFHCLTSTKHYEAHYSLFGRDCNLFLMTIVTTTTTKVEYIDENPVELLKNSSRQLQLRLDPTLII